MSYPHYHEDESGRLVKCYHKGLGYARIAAIWLVLQALSTTLMFPFEHALFTKVPFMRSLAEAMGVPMVPAWPRVTNR